MMWFQKIYHSVRQQVGSEKASGTLLSPVSRELRETKDEIIRVNYVVAIL
jgi:hypothetical protein